MKINSLLIICLIFLCETMQMNAQWFIKSNGLPQTSSGWAMDAVDDKNAVVTFLSGL